MSAPKTQYDGESLDCTRCGTFVRVSEGILVDKGNSLERVCSKCWTPIAENEQWGRNPPPPVAVAAM